MRVSVAERLHQLRQGGILVTAAEEGIVQELECKMDTCFCPRGKDYFEERPEPISDWAPSVDHVTTKSRGGQLTIDNIRLAHVLCNRVDYAIKNEIKHDKDLARARSGAFRDKSHPWAGLEDELSRLSADAEASAQASTGTSDGDFQRGRVAAYREITAAVRDLLKEAGEWS